MADQDKAYFAGGCFWGVEYLFKDQKGVLSTTAGYMGDGHLETVEVVFDPAKVDFETLTRFFFEIHDPTQVKRQGPDIGEQYQSAIFYVDDEQKQIANKLIDTLKNKGYKVATILKKAEKFYPAEDYHQDYYEKTGKTPYCHFYTKRF
ncbi:peptide-methionine (S)-S-oxide reductase [Candidatus Daviesbacteria bacterium]|nr:peptide-methionine (S)-S-oxide reductase [Candidatus Daviesbacteria bacterium]